MSLCHLLRKWLIKNKKTPWLTAKGNTYENNRWRKANYLDA